MKQLNGHKKIYLNDFLVIYGEVSLEEHLYCFGILIWLVEMIVDDIFFGEFLGF